MITAHPLVDLTVIRSRILYVKQSNSMALKALVESPPAPGTGCSDPKGEGVPAFFTRTGKLSRIYSLQVLRSFPTFHFFSRDLR